MSPALDSDSAQSGLLFDPSPAVLARSSQITAASALSFGVAIFLGTFLLFFVQLLLGKLILPIFGGAPAVWTSCIMFFQMLLLAGYALAHLLASRVRTSKQAAVVFSVLALSLVLLAVMTRFWPTPITPGESWRFASVSSPSLAIVRYLLGAIGLPFLILSTTSPLLQYWFSKVSPGASPYRLYALSKPIRILWTDDFSNLMRVLR